MIETNAGDLSYLLQILSPPVQSGGGALDSPYIYFVGNENNPPILHTYNRHMSVTLRLLSDDCEEFEALVEHDQLSNCISNHEDEDEILLDFSNPRELIVKSTRGTYRFKTASADSFRMKQTKAEEHLGSIDGDTLTHLIDAAGIFMAKSRGAGLMDSVHLYFDPETSTISAATEDRSILAHFTAPAEQIITEARVTLIGSMMRKISNFPGESTIDIYRDPRHNRIIFQGEYGRLAVASLTDKNARIDGHMQLFAQERPDGMHVDRKAFKQALARMSSWDAEHIVAKITPGGVVLEVLDRDKTGAKENPMDATATKEMKIYMNMDQMNRILKLSKEESLDIKLETERYSAVVTGQTGSLDYQIVFAAVSNRKN